MPNSLGAIWGQGWSPWSPSSEQDACRHMSSLSSAVPTAHPGRASSAPTSPVCGGWAGGQAGKHCPWAQVGHSDLPFCCGFGEVKAIVKASPPLLWLLLSLQLHAATSALHSLYWYRAAPKRQRGDRTPLGETWLHTTSYPAICVKQKF